MTSRERSSSDNDARGLSSTRRVTAAHLRALTVPGGRRTVLVLHDGELQVVDPDTAFTLAVDAEAQLLCTAADLRDTAQAYRASGTRDAVGAAVAATARYLTADWAAQPEVALDGPAGDTDLTSIEEA